MVDSCPLFHGRPQPCTVFIGSFPGSIHRHNRYISLSCGYHHPHGRMTGVITYTTNENTSAVIRHLAKDPSKPLRILLETDAPYMVPANLYDSIPAVKGRLPLCHTGMIPWTAEVVSNVAGEAGGVERVMKEGGE